MDQDYSQFQQVFFDESLDLINDIEKTLVNLDPLKIDTETINSIFRCAHTIKSSSGMFGFTSIMQFTHMMENYLEMVRNFEINLTSESIDTLLKSLDCLRNMIYRLQENKPPDDVIAKELEKKYLFLIHSKEMSMLDETFTQQDTRQNTSSKGWNIYFKPNLMIFQNGDDPLRIIRSLTELGKMQCAVEITRLRETEEFYADDCYLSWNIILETEKSEEEIRQFSFEWVEDDSVIIFSPLDSTVENESSRLKKTLLLSNHIGHINRESMSIRVATEKVDTLVNMVGELIITQLMLTQICSQDHHSKTTELKEALLRLEQNCKELQENVMRIRMLPISNIFNRFPRMVRDICKVSSKKIELTMTGENTELDKTVLEMISDPLAHLIRNSLDHGIEQMDERINAAKPGIGNLHLQAFHKGSNIVIQISDDGKGINAEKIFERAKELNLVTTNETLTPEECLDLIFLPGLSTVDKITDISGRGVGLDVVRKNINALGGQVSVSSVLGMGATFTITLPLTLAIMEGQLVRVGENTYVIPLISMTETIQIKSLNIRTIGQNIQTYYLRGHYIPIIKLYELFQIPVIDTNLESHLLVIIEFEKNYYGILIDELLQLQQVVIKSMWTHYGNIPGIAGATILGDGSVALILDAAGIIREFTQRHVPNNFHQTLSSAVG